LALLLVSGQIYIRDMRVISENQKSSKPFLIEVPKPVTLMNPSEKDEFIEEILKALEDK
jgi:vacuolar-type H+-ATPase subunit F/Vma7